MAQVDEVDDAGVLRHDDLPGDFGVGVDVDFVNVWVTLNDRSGIGEGMKDDLIPILLELTGYRLSPQNVTKATEAEDYGGLGGTHSRRRKKGTHLAAGGGPGGAVVKFCDERGTNLVGEFPEEVRETRVGGVAYVVKQEGTADTQERPHVLEVDLCGG